MKRIVKWLSFLTVAIVVISFATSHLAFAEEKTPVELIVSPQVWFSHIPTSRDVLGGDITPNAFFYPQWGGQLALRYGNWAFAVSALAANYQLTESFSPTTAYACGAGTCAAGTKIEDVEDSYRQDIDFSVSRTFFNVIENRLHLSLGVGIKWVEVEGTYTRVRPSGTLFGKTLTSREGFSETIVAAAFPVSLNFQITPRLFLPVGITPMVGSDTYKDRFDGESSETGSGGTIDAGLLYAITNAVSVYGGYRYQTVFGDADYAAHGPFIGLSFRFGLDK